MGRFVNHLRAPVMFAKTFCATLILAALTASATAEPIRLKLSFFTSDRELAFQAGLKPFIDAVNEEGAGVIEIEALTRGALGKFPEQADLVLNGVADIAFVNPGLTVPKFPEQQVVQMPGLFHSATDATRAYNGMIESGIFDDLKPFKVIVGFANYPLVIHTRPKVTSLAELKGKRMRVNNTLEAETLRSVGVLPVLMPINEVTDAISRGELDGATVPPGPLFEFGIARVASYHYVLPLGAAPLLVLMNKARFDSLPPRAQEIINKYSGRWLAEKYLEKYEAHTESVLEQLRTNPRRVVTEPTDEDLKTVASAFATVRADWLLTNPRRRTLFQALEQQLEKNRARVHKAESGHEPRRP
jgi:TRAP-type C4-dicarboxylate transport system substrate-binding protein